ncbi:hypothetical protein GJ688_03310 [Heliobacillus mobilis]|uniref:Uncharacterized protein n=1 Tax=Heliobacterium mobile TaxID=28064 RepID=A0A6I3SGT7_HELMO|nr:hypothetical protein [Heliobacterium mobile]MTV48007.1 hypothetical protein [Heliobacterium mobile]
MSTTKTFQESHWSVVISRYILGVVIITVSLYSLFEPNCTVFGGIRLMDVNMALLCVFFVLSGIYAAQRKKSIDGFDGIHYELFTIFVGFVTLIASFLLLFRIDNTIDDFFD